MVSNGDDSEFGLQDLCEYESATAPLWVLKRGGSYMKVMHSVSRQDGIDIPTFIGGTCSRQYDTRRIDEIGKVRPEILSAFNFLQEWLKSQSCGLELRRRYSS